MKPNLVKHIIWAIIFFIALTLLFSYYQGSVNAAKWSEISIIFHGVLVIASTLGVMAKYLITDDE